MTTTEQTPRHRPPSIVWPTILIVIGLLLLLSNFGWLPWGFWGSFWRLWPLILILVGLEIILTRGRGWSALATILFVIGVLVLLALAGLVAGVSNGFGPRVTTHLEERLVDLREARVTLEFGVGTLEVETLPSDSNNLIEGDFRHVQGQGPQKDFRRSNGRGSLRLSRGDNGFNLFGFGGEGWNIKLSPQIPLELDIKAGAANSNFDLSGLKLSRFNLDIGAASARIKFSRSVGTTEATINAGASNLDLEIPKEVEARIRADLGLASLDIDSTRFTKTGDSYITSDYDKASDRLDLRLKTGASSVTIR